MKKFSNGQHAHSYVDKESKEEHQSSCWLSNNNHCVDNSV